jgi:hypothetical protein
MFYGFRRLKIVSMSETDWSDVGVSALPTGLRRCFLLTSRAAMPIVAHHAWCDNTFGRQIRPAAPRRIRPISSH